MSDAEESYVIDDVISANCVKDHMLEKSDRQPRTWVQGVRHGIEHVCVHVCVDNPIARSVISSRDKNRVSLGYCDADQVNGGLFYICLLVE